jgi:hypothetical protein
MTQPPRTFTLTDTAPAAIAYGSACRARSDRPATATPGPAGEVLPEGGFDAQKGAREWLRHLDAGRIGGDWPFTSH